MLKAGHYVSRNTYSKLQLMPVFFLIFFNELINVTHEAVHMFNAVIFHAVCKIVRTPQKIKLHAVAVIPLKSFLNHTKLVFTNLGIREVKRSVTSISRESWRKL